MKTIDCTTCHEALPVLMLDGAAPSPALAAHFAACAACRQEWTDLQATWALMDEWAAPEPSTYFDSRLYARLREAQSAAPAGLWERMGSYLRFSTGRAFRPALAGALAMAALLGGGTAATLLAHHSVNPNASPTVNDLRIYDKNAQAIQDMDLLDESNDAAAAPRS